MKQKELLAVLKKKEIDIAILMTSEIRDPNFQYLTDMETDFGVLVFCSKPVVFCSELDYYVFSGSLQYAQGFGLSKYSKKTFEDINKKFKPRKIGVNYSNLTVSTLNILRRKFKGAKIVDISSELNLLRSKKTKKEIQIIKKAALLTEQIWLKTVNSMKKFKKEMDIKEFIEKQIKEVGAEPSFPIIVAAGKNSSVPHYPTSLRHNSKLRNFCIIDFGLRYKGYCTDITRTVFFGKPSEAQREYYALVSQAKKAAEKEIQKGVPFAKVSQSARHALGKYEKNFIHSLGHGIGVQVHESPHVSVNSKENVTSGQVFTIEPGVYLDRFGIRIEDDYLFETKLVALTEASTSLLWFN